MEILREQSAIDYLRRARSCLNPEVDNFGSIPLLAKLISLEQVFLTRLLAKGQTGLPLPMGDHGLPELAAWRIDIVKTFDEVAVIKENRARDLEGVLQEFANASTSGIDKTFEGLQKTLQSDAELLKALGEFSEEEEEFLTQKWDSSRFFPFYTDRSIPGLLLSKSDRSPFSERRGFVKRFKKSNFRPGFKYVDTGEKSHIDPFFIMVAFSTTRESLGFRLISKEGGPLLERCALLETNEQGGDAKPGENGPSITYLDLGLERNPQDKSKIAGLERSLQNLRPPIFRALYQTDYTGKSGVLNGYFHSLFELNTLVEEADKFSEEILGLKPIDPQEAQKIKSRLASEVYRIYNSVEDNDLRKVLQIAAAEAMQATRKETEAAKYRPISQGNFLSRFKIHGKRD